MRSGFLAAACVALRAILYGRFAEDGSEAARACLPSGCSIALVTFDDAVHLYDLSVCTPLGFFDSTWDQQFASAQSNIT